jgi:hypothetical protein
MNSTPHVLMTYCLIKQWIRLYGVVLKHKDFTFNYTFVRWAVIDKMDNIVLYWIILDRYEPKFSGTLNFKCNLKQLHSSVEEIYGPRAWAPHHGFIL